MSLCSQCITCSVVDVVGRPAFTLMSARLLLCGAGGNPTPMHSRKLAAYRLSNERGLVSAMSSGRQQALDYSCRLDDQIRVPYCVSGPNQADRLGDAFLELTVWLKYDWDPRERLLKLQTGILLIRSTKLFGHEHLAHY